MNTGGMLDQPDWSARVGVRARVEGLHRAPGGLVGDAPEPARDHSTIITIGCFESSE